MDSEKHSHGATLHQCLVLAIIARDGPLTSGEVAARYHDLAGCDVARNYQYIITRRMADKGLIRAAGGKEKAVYQWAITPAGKKLLGDATRLSQVLAAM